MPDLTNTDAIRLFSDYLKVTGVAHITPEPSGDPALIGKRIGATQRLVVDHIMGELLRTQIPAGCASGERGQRSRADELHAGASRRSTRPAAVQH